MRQLSQKLKNGKIQILEVPMPSLKRGHLLVQNCYSLISPGSETSTVETGRKSLIGKVKSRPREARQVIDSLKRVGPIQTYRAVMKRLNVYSSLGYSCAGIVVGVGLDAKGFRVGDRVACGGFSACHAEMVSVPVNLCVKIESDVDLKEAAYNTLGAIALQGVRQADVRLGETCAIIGLGLVGQLTGLLLKASGVKTVGIDIDAGRVDIGSKNCVDLALLRNDGGIRDKILQFTDGLGCDAVIITASTSSFDPINFAGSISRKKGTIVVVGAVPTGFDREPHFYNKELQLKMSCSYGPGRYDPLYEEKAIDYPPAYVRWTQNRNMIAFQEMIYFNKIDLSYLTTHIFKLDDAPAAYEMMLSKSERFIGILIEYNAEKKTGTRKIHLKPHGTFRESKPVSIGFIGAGSYAQSHLLPYLSGKNKDITLKGVMTLSGASSRSVGERYGFEYCTTDEKEILDSEEINTVFIATRHDSHAKYVLESLKAGKHVFVEKPLCLTFEELEDIKNYYLSIHLENQQFMVGYNRRFSPLAEIVKKEFGDCQMAVIYRVNAGSISSDNWIQDTEIGGGRVIGEVCHFVDFLNFINGSLPVSVHAITMKDVENLDDTLIVSLSYQNGTIGTISYFSNGDKSVPKERIEIYANGRTAILDDFRRLAIHVNGRKKVKRFFGQNKGQKNQVNKFIHSILRGTGPLITFSEIYSASLITFAITESAKKGEPIKLDKLI